MEGETRRILELQTKAPSVRVTLSWSVSGIVICNGSKSVVTVEMAAARALHKQEDVFYGVLCKIDEKGSCLAKIRAVSERENI